MLFMTKRAQPYLVEGKRQLAALASGARQEIVDVLPRLGTASVAQIAEALGRPPDALYYHLRALEKVGLVIPSGFRQKGGRREALFKAVSSQVGSRLEPRTPERAKAVTAMVGSMLRMGLRDYRRSIKRPDVKLTGSNRELWAARTTGWLTSAQVSRVIRSIERLLLEVSKKKGPGRLYGVTLVFTPLHGRHRARI
jgi:DNA-binding transcriptional ArsR family regulator